MRRVAVVAAVALAVATMGESVTAQQQQYVFNPAEDPASWENPQPSCDLPVVCDGLGTPDLVFGEPFPGSQGSSVSLVTNEFTVTQPDGQLVAFATFEFCNGQVLGGTALDSADFVVRYAVTAEPLQTFGETVTFVNTPNVGDPIGDADFLFLADNPNSQFRVLEDECGVVELEVEVRKGSFIFGPILFGRVLTPDTAFVTTETVGLVDPASGMWHLRNGAGVVTSFFYGNPVDLPISGDWNGDGISTPGLYRQSDGFFYARNANSAGPADNSCFAGNPADIPIAGDWDGDGDDNLGIYRPSEQTFYLFTVTCTGSPMGPAQFSFLFGDPGDKPVAGDWDGDGKDEVGLHRESTGFFYWRNTLDTGNASGQIFFGDPGDRFVAGDWGMVDGKDTPAIFRPSDLTYYFRHTLTQGVADSQFTWNGAGSGWLPVSGSFGLG